MSETKNDFLIMDGGMGHLLKDRGIRIPGLAIDQQFLAGALANLEHPEQVKAIHREYLEAGSRLVTTNNFVATPYYMKKVGRDDEMYRLIEVRSEIGAKCALNTSTASTQNSCSSRITRHEE